MCRYEEKPMPQSKPMTIEDWKDLARRCRQWAKDAKKRGDKQGAAHWSKSAEELERLIRKLEQEERCHRLLER